MNINLSPVKDALISIFNPAKRMLPALNDRTGLAAAGTGFIRFEERKDRYIWADPDEIIFVKSADHYVKSLVQCGREKKWMTRHSTLKELLDILPGDNFIRLNKFYLLNVNYFSHFNENLCPGHKTSASSNHPSFDTDIFLFNIYNIII